MRRLSQCLLILTVSLALLTPTPVYACDSWICLGDIFGWTDVAKVHADRDTKLATEDTARAEKVKMLDVQIQTNLSAARTEVQRIQEAQYESDNQRQIAIRNAELQFAAYQAQLDSAKETQLKAYDAQIAAGQDQANIAQTGIREAGWTQRVNIEWNGSYNIVTVLVVGAILAYFIRRRTAHPEGAPAIYVVTASPQALAQDQPAQHLAEEWTVVAKPVNQTAAARLTRQTHQVEDKRQYLAK